MFDNSIQDLIKKDEKTYQLKGFNTSQAKSLAWADFFSKSLSKKERLFELECKNCSILKTTKIPSDLKDFIFSHKDHRTYTKAIKETDFEISEKIFYDSDEGLTFVQIEKSRYGIRKKHVGKKDFDMYMINKDTYHPPKIMLK